MALKSTHPARRASVKRLLPGKRKRHPAPALRSGPVAGCDAARCWHRLPHERMFR